MKGSFWKSSSSKPVAVKPSVSFEDGEKSSNADGVEYVTEFNASKTLTDNGSKANGAAIPPMENEWRPATKKMKNLELPIAESDGSGAGGGLQFEVGSSTSAADGVDSRMSYGLNLRQSAKVGGGEEALAAELEFVSTEDVLLQRCKYDLKRLPEDRGMEEFEDRPVEGFGAALLGGYGWKEGMGIGRNTKEDVKVMEIAKRGGKFGIGFVADHVPFPSAPNPNPNPNPNGTAKEKVRERVRVADSGDRGGGGGGGGQLREGTDVRIIFGRHEGLKGRVLKESSNGRLVVKLSRSEESVTVHAGDVAELGSKKEERCLKRLKELKIREHVDRKASKRAREEAKRGSGGGSSQSDTQSYVGQEVSWLRSHIRVKIISKDLKDGRLYLKKGVVVDVVGPKVCDIAMDGGRELIQGVSQELLETALPRRGGPVVVLYGKHRGVYGKLMERDLDRETGVVEDADTLALINVRLEQIAEYIGEPEIY